MYYIYVKDVPKFNSKLAENLNIFYNDITSAEADRQDVQNYIDTNKITDSDWASLKDPHLSAYMDMRMDIINASQLEPVIIQELNQTITNESK